MPPVPRHCVVLEPLSRRRTPPGPPLKATPAPLRPDHIEDVPVCLGVEGACLLGPPAPLLPQHGEVEEVHWSQGVGRGELVGGGPRAGGLVGGGPRAGALVGGGPRVGGLGGSGVTSKY